MSVSASYPGANAKTVAQAVGVPIEAQINGVEGMMYMSSSSSQGSYNLTVTFENGTDLDQAAIDVQNRMSQVTSTLPEAVTQQGVSVRKESTNQVLFCVLEADDPERYDALYLANYAQLNLVDRCRVSMVSVAWARLAPESTACASGSTRRRCASADSVRRMSPRRSSRRTWRYQPGLSATFRATATTSLSSHSPRRVS